MKMKEEGIVMKNRSYRATIAAGYHFYFRYFVHLFKVSWLMSLLYAAICSALGTLLIVQLPAITVGIRMTSQITPQTITPYFTTLAIIGVLFIVGGIVEMLSYGTVFALMKEQKDTGAIVKPTGWFRVRRFLLWRTVKGFLFTLLLCIVLCPLFPLLLPFSFVMMKYIMTDRHSYWKHLWADYKTGLRRWGFIFVVLLVSGIILLIFTFIATLPMFILFVANTYAHAGVLMGDPLGMPAYMPALTAATFFFAGFIAIYLRIAFFSHLYYMYGSIEAQASERKQQLNKIQ